MKPLRKICSLFGPLLPALLVGATAAAAASFNWTAAHDYTVSGGTQAPSNNPGVINSASGWIDVNGNVWGVNATNQLYAAYTTSPWQTGELARPSSEAAINGHYRGKFVPLATSNTDANYSISRYTKTGGVTSGYVCGVSSNNGSPGNVQPYINTLISGAFGTATRGANVAVTPTTTYVYDCQTVQLSASQTQIINTVYAADGITVLGTATLIDSTPSLQNVSSPEAIFEGRGSAGDSHLVTTELTTYTPGVATAYNVVQPAYAVAGQAATLALQANGTLAGAINVSASASDGGSFSPSPASLAAGTFPYSSVSYTATTAGNNTLTFTNSGALTNPSAVVEPVYQLLPVNGPACLFSPANWKGDTGRSGSVWRQSWNPGAWIKCSFNTGASPVAIVGITPSSASNKISYILNGTLVDNVAGTGNITLSPAASGVNNLTVFIRNSGGASTRWNNGVDTVRITGLLVDNASSAATAPAARPWVWVIGDSITEGVETDPGATNNWLHDYSFMLYTALDSAGYDVGLSACGFSGWLWPGDSTSDVPPWYFVSGSSGGTGGTYNDANSRWNKIDQGVSLLDSSGQISSYGATGTAPVAIVVNYAVNDFLNTTNVSDMQSSVTQWLVAARAAAPNAKIMVIMPFGFDNVAKYGTSYPAALRAGVAAYQAAYPSDANVKLLDYGANLANLLQTSGSGDQTGYLAVGSTVHPNQAGQTLFGSLVIKDVVTALKPSAVAAPYRSGFHF